MGAGNALTTTDRVIEAPPAPMQVILNSLLRSLNTAVTAEPDRALTPVYSRFHAPLPTHAETLVALQRKVVVRPAATLVAVAENSRVGDPSVLAAQTPLSKNNRNWRAILCCAILIHRGRTRTGRIVAAQAQRTTYAGGKITSVLASISGRCRYSRATSAVGSVVGAAGCTGADSSALRHSGCVVGLKLKPQRELVAS